MTIEILNLKWSITGILSDKDNTNFSIYFQHQHCLEASFYFRPEAVYMSKVEHIVPRRYSLFLILMNEVLLALDI